MKVKEQNSCFIAQGNSFLLSIDYRFLFDLVTFYNYFADSGEL